MAARQERFSLGPDHDSAFNLKHWLGKVPTSARITFNVDTDESINSLVVTLVADWEEET